MSKRVKFDSEMPLQIIPELEPDSILIPEQEANVETDAVEEKEGGSGEKKVIQFDK
jgi:hypothetical protein